MRRWARICASICDLDDAILEVNVTPNRGDAMSVLGIAREVAALTGAALRTPAPARATQRGGTPARRDAFRGDARMPAGRPARASRRA